MKKMSFKKILGMKAFFIIVLFLVGLFGFNFFKEYNRNRQLNAEIKNLEEMAKDLEAQNLDILKVAKYLDTEEFLESEARTKLGLQKPGETTIVVNIPGADTATTTSIINVSDRAIKTSNVKEWWRYFFEKS